MIPRREYSRANRNESAGRTADAGIRDRETTSRDRETTLVVQSRTKTTTPTESNQGCSSARVTHRCATAPVNQLKQLRYVWKNRFLQRPTRFLPRCTTPGTKYSHIYRAVPYKTCDYVSRECRKIPLKPRRPMPPYRGAGFSSELFT